MSEQTHGSFGDRVDTSAADIVFGDGTAAETYEALFADWDLGEEFDDSYADQDEQQPPDLAEMVAEAMRKRRVEH